MVFTKKVQKGVGQIIIMYIKTILSHKNKNVNRILFFGENLGSKHKYPRSI